MLTTLRAGLGSSGRQRLTTDDAENTDEEEAPPPIREIRVIRGQQTPWGRLGEAQRIVLGVALKLFSIGTAVFQRRDSKS